MGKHRQQHRPPSDQKLLNRQLADVKRENLALRRKISKLQKQLQKFFEKKIEDDDAETLATSEQPAAFLCQACPSRNVVVVKLPIGDMLVCRDCRWRKRV